MLFVGLEISQFTRYLCQVVTAITDDIDEHVSISDWQKRCGRFCSFIGEMILIAVSQDCTDNSFKAVVDILASQSLEKWITFDQVKTENELGGSAVCLTGLLKVIGPIMEEQNISFGNIDTESIFSSVRDHVLSASLSR
ncbi:hypothetical protein QZH41_012960 [Actinostola sp. cb2023]|nr:hypothetical protein QZH41_012960 [Actinostola sp. cb2023]